MLVFYKESLVFLAVPKTASTGYHVGLAPFADMVVSNPPELKHAPFARYNRFFRPLFEKVCDRRMDTLAVMREPTDWLGSWYRYRRRPEMSGHPNATHHISFDDFVQAYLRGKKPAFADVGSQSKFLAPRPDGSEMTHIFRYEQLDRLDDFLRHRLGDLPELPRLNVSPVMDLSLLPATRKKLFRKCAEDFDLHASLTG